MCPYSGLLVFLSMTVDENVKLVGAFCGDGIFSIPFGQKIYVEFLTNIILVKYSLSENTQFTYSVSYINMCTKSKNLEMYINILDRIPILRSGGFDMKNPTLTGYIGQSEAFLFVQIWSLYMLFFHNYRLHTVYTIRLAYYPKAGDHFVYTLYAAVVPITYACDAVSRQGAVNSSLEKENSSLLLKCGESITMQDYVRQMRLRISPFDVILVYMTYTIAPSCGSMEEIIHHQLNMGRSQPKASSLSKQMTEKVYKLYSSLNIMNVSKHRRIILLYKVYEEQTFVQFKISSEATDIIEVTTNVYKDNEILEMMHVSAGSLFISYWLLKLMSIRVTVTQYTTLNISFWLNDYCNYIHWMEVPFQFNISCPPVNVEYIIVKPFFKNGTTHKEITDVPLYKLCQENVRIQLGNHHTC